jgi:two-component system response regulator AtoC
MEKLSVLIVDDEEVLRQNVAATLKSHLSDISFTVTEAVNGKQAIDLVDQGKFDLVLMDVKMPELDGLEALKIIKEHDPSTFVVIMTAHGNLQDAITAIKEGAYDYLEKPVQPEKLSQLVRRALEAREMVSSLALSNPIFDDDLDTDFVGNSQKMKEVYNLIYKLCKVDTTVLVRGENGTGKELVAKAIHLNSHRKGGQFVAINCGAIPENLMESELFGHEKGAFTGASERRVGKFQLANNGTLFLDEVAELKPEMQVKLLRVLQEKTFVPVGGNREVKTNTRIIAATNQNIEKMMEDGQFREDLFYRLNVMPIFLPPLRDRKEDLPSLVQHFIKKFSKIHSSKIANISVDALKLLTEYRWPGNIRELENTIERAFIVESGSQIEAASLPDQIRFVKTETISKDQNRELNFETFKESSEKEFIISALMANKGKINQTVAHANIPKNTLLRKIRKYNIDPEDYK